MLALQCIMNNSIAGNNSGCYMASNYVCKLCRAHAYCNLKQPKGVVRTTDKIVSRNTGVILALAMHS